MGSKIVGRVRGSEIITTFGPGSVFYGKNGVSVMMMGLDMWPEAFNVKDDLSKFKVIQNQFLEDACHKEHFRMPMVDDGRGAGIPSTPFPTWGYCEYCKIMSEVSGKPDREKGYYICKRCQRKSGHKNRILSARLVLICDYGHVQDFPWIEWAHSKTRNQDPGICKNPLVEWTFGRRGTTLSNYGVRCITCNKYRSMYGATEPLDQILPSKNGGLLELKCKGSSPWLDKNSRCPPKKDGNGGKILMRGNHVRASNMYFPITISSLQIPRFDNPIQRIIDRKREVINYLREEGRSLEQISKEKFFADVNEQQPGKVLDELRYRFENSVSNMDDIKTREYRDLMQSDDISFRPGRIISISNVEIHPELQAYISNIKKIDRLTMIQTLRAFTRGNVPDPFDHEGTNVRNHMCRISKSTKIDWLPCVETKGEGILITLDDKRLKEWAKSASERSDKIMNAFREFSHKRGWFGEIHQNYILLHTLSHVLIRTLADSSGYGESSINERIYSDENMNAILLYTSSNSSEGSLGGLVRNATRDDFHMMMKDAITKSRICSRDPLCRESSLDEGPPHARLNGSACYACTLLPETSCENFNRLLDRKLLTDEIIGFFDGLE